MNFIKWLKLSSNLSDSSIDKYSGAVNTVSKEMLAEHVIAKPIAEMEIYEIDLAIAVIFRTKSFIEKDTRGNHMYSNALKWYRSFVSAFSEKETSAKAEEERVLLNPNISETERRAIVKSRIGQGQFRDKLLFKYKKCIITGISIPQVLVASHIKPWAACDNKERLDVDNGLILSATYDRLFDSGLISFNENGRLYISRAINENNRSLLALDLDKQYLIGFSGNMASYLQYHNDVIYLR